MAVGQRDVAEEGEVLSHRDAADISRGTFAGRAVERDLDRGQRRHFRRGYCSCRSKVGEYLN